MLASPQYATGREYSETGKGQFILYFSRIFNLSPQLKPGPSFTS